VKIRSKPLNCLERKSEVRNRRLIAWSNNFHNATRRLLDNGRQILKRANVRNSCLPEKISARISAQDHIEFFYWNAYWALVVILRSMSSVPPSVYIHAMNRWMDFHEIILESFGKICRQSPIYIKIIFFFLLVGWDFGYCGRYWPIVPTPGDRWWWLWRNWWNEDRQGKPKKYSEKTCPSATLSTTNPTWLDPDKTYFHNIVCFPFELIRRGNSEIEFNFLCQQSRNVFTHSGPPIANTTRLAV
jgi:hypothetical protein